METKSIYTIRSLLEELKEKFPKFEENQIFETLKSIYPNEKVDKSKKNITIEGKTFTKPLATNRKDKNNLLKEGSVLANFFKNTSRGDFLRVVKTDGEKAKCINLSLLEEIKERFYSDEESLINLSIEDLANGTVKPFKRKVDKYIKKTEEQK